MWKPAERRQREGEVVYSEVIGREQGWDSAQFPVWATRRYCASLLVVSGMLLLNRSLIDVWPVAW